MAFGNPLAEKKCATCKASLGETAKQSKVPNFIYCDNCKAVYAVREAQQIMHPEYGPVVLMEIELFRKGKIPKERLSDADAKDMLRTIKDSFGPEQFKELLMERGNTLPETRDIEKRLKKKKKD